MLQAIKKISNCKENNKSNSIQENGVQSMKFKHSKQHNIRTHNIFFTFFSPGGMEAETGVSGGQ